VTASEEVAAGQSRREDAVDPIVDRNIRALCHRRQAEAAAAATWQARAADRMTRFAGSMPFICLHVAVFGLWIMANLGWIPGIAVWDPSFAVLAMVASVEAIFLSTFVLITQNRMAAAADKRADLDLQISLLVEHEVTKLAVLVTAVAKRLNVAVADDPEIEQVQAEVTPEVVLDRLDSES
jgi:uncharacterized membrane protein